jgi:hypothetical protein
MKRKIKFLGKSIVLGVSVFTMNTAKSQSNYCVPTSGSKSIGITEVKFLNVDNFSVNNTYSDFSNISGNVLLGPVGPTGTQPDFAPFWVVVTVSTTNAIQHRIWIDWNSDGDFSDANETILTSKLAGNLFGAQVTVPKISYPGGTTYSYGAKRMRVRMSDATTGGISISSCGYSIKGETEDYTINVVRPPLRSAEISSESIKFPTENEESPSILLNVSKEKELAVNYRKIDGTAQIQICNAMGQLVFNEEVQAADNTVQLVDLSRFDNGMYFVNVQSGSFSESKRIILE